MSSTDDADELDVSVAVPRAARPGAATGAPATEPAVGVGPHPLPWPDDPRLDALAAELGTTKTAIVYGLGGQGTTNQE